jgi:hypothetical protein
MRVSMKSSICGIALAGFAILATPAAAGTFNVSLTGTLTQQGHEFWPGLNTGIDPNLSVGSIVTLTASFDASLLLPYAGNPGEYIVGLWGLPTSGSSFFRVDAGGMTWASTDSLSDGMFPFSTSPREAYPAIVIDGDKVAGLIGNLSPNESSARPELDFGGGNSAAFDITAPQGLYGDLYNTPGFNGVWDFADSSVVDPPSASDIAAGVPEPATWAMFLIGFGAVGFAMRRKKEMVLAS